MVDLGWSFWKFWFSFTGQKVIESLLHFSTIGFVGIFRAVFSKLNIKEVNRCSFDKMVSG